MKMSDKLEAAFTNQIGMEFYSSYIYLQMAAYCDDQHFPGIANWLRLQSQEEWDHGIRFFDYVLGRGNMVVLPAIDAPRYEFASILELFEDVYAHEQKVSGDIQKLYTVATAENDFASYSILQWFVNEQVEEENAAEAIVARLRLIGNHTPAIIMLDHELGARSGAASE